MRETQPLLQGNRVGTSLRSSLSRQQGCGPGRAGLRDRHSPLPGSSGGGVRGRGPAPPAPGQADLGSGAGAPTRGQRPGEARPAARPSARSRLLPTPTSRRRGSRPLTTHFLPRKVKRDSFSCGVSSRDPTLATLRGGGCCWPELMVPPARLGVQGRLLRRVGERAFPSVTGAGGGESQAQHLATPPAPGGGGGHGKEEPAAGRAEKGGSPQLPPGEALAGGPQSSRSGDRATLPTPPALLRRRRPHDPTWLRGGRDHGRRARGSAPETRGCGPAGRNHPVRRGSRRAARAPPPSGGGARRAVGRGLRSWSGAGPVGSALGRSGLAAAAGREGWSPPRSCGPLSDTRTPLRSARAAPGAAPASGARPRDVTPPWNPEAGGTPGRSALPCAPRGLRSEPQVPGLPSTVSGLGCRAWRGAGPRPRW